jgi:hypothetical protein
MLRTANWAEGAPRPAQAKTYIDANEHGLGLLDVVLWNGSFLRRLTAVQDLAAARSSKGTLKMYHRLDSNAQRQSSVYKTPFVEHSVPVSPCMYGPIRKLMR